MSHRRGPWSQAEDAYLVRLVHTQGPLNWVRIAQLIGSRSPKQCRERYHQNLKPSLNHEPITAEEGRLIERLVAEMGKRWAEIARRLHGRSDNAVKNWWNGSMNRRQRLTLRRRSFGPHHNASSNDRTTHLSVPKSSLPMSSMPPINTHATYPSSSSSSLRPDMTLPSPSGSESSRADSYEAPPSLISDTGSAYSISPRTTTSPHFALPPLTTIPRTDRTPSLPMLYPSSAEYSPSSPDGYAWSHRKSSDAITFPHYQHSPPASAWSWSTRPVTPSLGRVKLPPLQLYKGARASPVQRDSRMRVSALMD